MSRYSVCVTLGGLDFDVEFYYSPAEAEVRYYADGSGYPGCPEEFEIISVHHGNTDFTNFFLERQDLVDEVEKTILNN